MSQRPRGRGNSKKSLLVQRPLRKYKEERLARDEEFARRLQREEEERHEAFVADELLAKQIEQQMNGDIEKPSPMGEVMGDDGDYLQNEFARYRGMTGVDSLLAEQLQLQEEETASPTAAATASSTAAATASSTAAATASVQRPSDSWSTRSQHSLGPGPRQGVSQRGRINVFLPAGSGSQINVRVNGRGPQNLGTVRTFRFGQRQPASEEVLPEGEDDPVTLLLTQGGGADIDFLNIMQDPLLLVMAMSRAAHINGVEGNVNLDDYEGLWDLAERLGEVQRRGVSDSELDAIPTYTFQAGAAAETGRCQVCLSDFEQGETIRRLPCLHEYHRTCIDEWLKRNASCPVCRKEVRP